MAQTFHDYGLGASYRACGDYADSLEELGIATLCFDFRGGSDNSKSDGSPKEMSFLTEMDDLETIIEEVKKWDFIDTDNIILMGSSQGGAISALISAEREDIKGTVLLYPALGIPEVVTKWYPSKEEIPEEIDYRYYADRDDIYRDEIAAIKKNVPLEERFRFFR